LAYAVAVALAVWGFADVPGAYLNPTVAIAPRRAGRLRLA
jgi:glycerol uptake facilitator-like aquaporin